MLDREGEHSPSIVPRNVVGIEGAVGIAKPSERFRAVPVLCAWNRDITLEVPHPVWVASEKFFWANLNHTFVQKEPHLVESTTPPR